MGLRLPDGFQVEATDAWRAGLVEIQDEGSQLLAIACDARAGMTVVDLCAGAGGKTMALAAEMGNRSEEHTSELQSLMRTSYAVFCLKKKTLIQQTSNKSNK